MSRADHPSGGGPALTTIKTCEMCGRPIITPRLDDLSRRRIPLDAEPKRNGTAVLLPDGTCSIVGTRRTEPGTLRYSTHNSTCDHSVAHLPSRRRA